MQTPYIHTYGPHQKIPQSISDRLILPQQTHSPHIQEIKNLRLSTQEKEKIKNCDGLYTSVPQVFLGIKTADCAPIILHGKTTRDQILIAALHAGWRGLCNGIIEDALNIFEDRCKGNFFIHVGPILPQFEIQKDFCYHQISQKFGTQFFQKPTSKTPNSQIIFQFEEALKHLLSPNAIFDPRSTQTDKDLASWRENKTANRNITVAGFL